MKTMEDLLDIKNSHVSTTYSSLRLQLYQHYSIKYDAVLYEVLVYLTLTYLLTYIHTYTHTYLLTPWSIVLLD